MDMQHVLKHAAWMWTCSLFMDVQPGRGYGQATCACTCWCPGCMTMSMLHFPAHAAYPYPYCMDLNMHHWHRYAACTWIDSMDMDMQHRHGHAACIGTWTCSMDLNMLHGQRQIDAAYPSASLCSISMSSCCMLMFHGQVYAACSCPSCGFISMLHVNVQTVFMYMSMLHLRVQTKYGHGHVH
jgi:hypothetical protein